MRRLSWSFPALACSDRQGLRGCSTGSEASSPPKTQKLVRGHISSSIPPPLHLRASPPRGTAKQESREDELRGIQDDALGDGDRELRLRLHHPLPLGFPYSYPFRSARRSRGGPACREDSRSHSESSCHGRERSRGLRRQGSGGRRQTAAPADGSPSWWRYGWYCRRPARARMPLQVSSAPSRSVFAFLFWEFRR